MGFFDFVKEDDGERLLHDLGGEAEGIGSAVSNEAIDIVSGDEFVHIEANDVIFAVKINFGEGFG